MLHRLFLNLTLFLIFALVQIGVVTHEISHLSELTQQAQHSNLDKNSSKQHSTTDQCGQCIASAQAVSGLPSLPFIVYSNQGEFQLSTTHVAFLASVLIAPYSARAPPQHLIS
jgi:hypothetical protein